MVRFSELSSHRLIEPLLAPGQNTVGAVVHVRHMAPTLEGQSVRAEIELIEVDRRRLRFKIQLFDELEQIGDSLLVVGDASALKVHVHTDDPGVALSLGTRLGVVEGVEIANMHHQAAQREERLLDGVAVDLTALEAGVVAVCPGMGNRRLFESLGAVRVIEGGQTMNPSAADILEAIDATPTDDVIVLPNNSNVVLTAEQAPRSRSTKPAPCGSSRPGRASCLARRPARRGAGTDPAT